jgi:glutamine cyclotransferase
MRLPKYSSSRKTMKTMSLLLSVLILLFHSIGCADRSTRQMGHEPGYQQPNKPKPGRSRIKSPESGQRIKFGENLQIILEPLDDTPVIDSVIFLFGSERVGKSFSAPWLCNWKVSGVKIGNTTISALVYYNNKATATNRVSIVVLPENQPANLSYRILNVYPHDIHAYTQGLIYEDGFLYEGTGQYNESSLRKVNIKTGEPLRVLNLSGEIFGEGITIFGSRIFQLTYKYQVGFVYDKESFERLQKVYYENKEGWGLTNDESQLIMSDGSNLIYFMDPEYFTENSRVEVYDEKGPVEKLNELEYINGKIYANIYGSDEIVVIDPKSGAVVAKINFKGILPEKDRHNRIDVFNGIAYDTDNQTLLVTGKYWPKLFEVKLSEMP